MSEEAKTDSQFPGEKLSDMGSIQLVRFITQRLNIAPNSMAGRGLRQLSRSDLGKETRTHIFAEVLHDAFAAAKQDDTRTKSAEYFIEKALLKRQTEEGCRAQGGQLLEFMKAVPPARSGYALTYSNTANSLIHLLKHHTKPSIEKLKSELTPTTVAKLDALPLRDLAVVLWAAKTHWEKDTARHPSDAVQPEGSMRKKRADLDAMFAEVLGVPKLQDCIEDTLKGYDDMEQRLAMTKAWKEAAGKFKPINGEENVYKLWDAIVIAMDALVPDQRKALTVGH